MTKSWLFRHWKTTNITLLLSKMAHDLVNDLKLGLSTLKEILSTVLPDLMRVGWRVATEMLNSFRTKNS